MVEEFGCIRPLHKGEQLSDADTGHLPIVLRVRHIDNAGEIMLIAVTARRHGPVGGCGHPTSAARVWGASMGPW